MILYINITRIQQIPSQRKERRRQQLVGGAEKGERVIMDFLLSKPGGSVPEPKSKMLSYTACSALVGHQPVCSVL